MVLPYDCMKTPYIVNGRAGLAAPEPGPAAFHRVHALRRKRMGRGGTRPLPTRLCGGRHGEHEPAGGVLPTWKYPQFVLAEGHNRAKPVNVSEEVM